MSCFHGALRFQEGHAAEAKLLYTQLREFKLKAGSGRSDEELCSLVVAIRWFMFPKEGIVRVLSQHAATMGQRPRASAYLARKTTFDHKVATQHRMLPTQRPNF